jgi:CHAT domain-containing protein
LYRKVRKIVSGLRQRSQRGPSEESGEAALSELVLGASAKAAVEALEEDVARKPGDARLLSDLSAAYLVLSQQADDPRDLVRALDAAARAREVDPFLRAALFNFALAAEGFQLRRLAQSAWTEYRDGETDPGWKAEASIHLEALGQPSAQERWRRALPDLEAAALRGDEAEVQHIVAIDPQAAREHALEERLGEWGDRLLAGDQAGAARSLRVAAAVGHALLSIHGDSTIQAAVEAIERVGTSRVADLAQGHRAFRDALRHFQALKTKEAALRFAEARDGFRRGGSPIELWAQAGLGRVDGYDSRFEEANATFLTVLDRAQLDGFPSLAGWCQWGIGWLKSRQGHTAEVLAPFHAAEAAYERLGEFENTATIWSYLAQTFSSLGQNGEAWRYWFRALARLSDRPDSERRHTLLRDAAIQAVEAGLPHGGLAIQEEGLLAAQAVQKPVRLAESYSNRSRILLILGREREARQNLRLAFRHARKAEIDSPRKKLFADLTLAWGEALRRLAPDAALKPLTEAIDAYREIRAIPSLTYASLSRARLNRSLGRDAEGEDDLRMAIGFLEDPGSELSDPDLQISLSDSLQNVYDEWIDLLWTHRKSPEEALYAVERARVFAQGGRWAPSGVASGVGSRLPGEARLTGNGLVVEYAVLKDRLLIWCIGPDGLSWFEREVGQREVEARVEAFLRAIRRKAAPEEISKLSSDLYDLLVPESVARLQSGETLYLVPDKILHKVPFAALLDPARRRFLVEDHPLAVMPGALTMLKGEGKPVPVSQPPRSKARVLFVGNPTFDRDLFRDLDDLPGAEKEIAAVRAAFPRADVMLGLEAGKTQFLANLDRYDVLVFAGHSVSNAAQPFRSYLLLAPTKGDVSSGVLFGTELRGRRFERLRTVVLSSCESIGPRSSRASGLTGMARPFLEAGVDTVVGSLWNVDDQTTAPFFLSFYIALARGQPAAAALRTAQLQAIRNREDALRSISIWAAFETVNASRTYEMSHHSN